jgi:hypothetical protein
MALSSYAVLDGDIPVLQVDASLGNSLPPSTVDRFYQGKIIRFSDGSDDRRVTNFYTAPVTAIPTFILDAPLNGTPQVPQVISVVASESWLAKISSPFSQAVPRYPAYKTPLPEDNVTYERVGIAMDSKVFAMSAVRHSDNTIGVVYQTYQQVKYVSSTDEDGLLWSTPAEITFGASESANQHGVSVAIVNSNPAVLFTSTLDTLVYAYSTSVRGSGNWTVTTVTATIDSSTVSLTTSLNLSASEGNTWNSIAYGNNVYVAVSTSGSVPLRSAMYSASGTSWTSAITTVAAWSSVCFSTSVYGFMAVSNGGVAATGAMTSTDGITWSNQNVGNTSVWNDVCWADSISRFVAVGNSASMVSIGGSGSWTTLSTPAFTWKSVVWSDDLYKFVAIGTNYTMTCSPSFSWQTSVLIGNWTCLDWSPELSLFVAVRANDVQAAHSTNGTEWTFDTISSFSVAWSSVAWSSDAKLFLAVGDDFASYSNDGITWQSPFSLTGGPSIADVTWNGLVAGTVSTTLLPRTSQSVFTYELVDEPLQVASDSLTPMQATPPRGQTLSFPDVIVPVNAGYPEFMITANALYKHNRQILFVRGNTSVITPTWVVVPMWLDDAFTVPATGKAADISSSLLVFAAQYNSVSNNTLLLSATTGCFVTDTGSIGIATPDSYFEPGVDITTFAALQVVGYPQFGASSVSIPKNTLSSGTIDRTVTLLSMVYRDTDSVVHSTSQLPESVTYNSDVYLTASWGTYPDLVLATTSTANNVLVTDFPFTTDYLGEFEGSAFLGWVSRSSAADNDWRSVTWAPELSLFVAVAETGSGNRVMKSANGSLWTTSSSAADYSWQSFAWSPTLTLGAAVALTVPATIPLTWVTGTNPSATSGWTDLSWAPEISLFVAVSPIGSSRVMTSPNGIAWTTRTAPTFAWRSVGWSPQLTLFVALTQDVPPRIMTSANGVSWTTRTTPTGTYTVFSSPVWAASLNLFVATGSTSLTSVNGISWTTVGTPPSLPTYIAWSPELSIFGGVSTPSSLAFRSSNGTSWTSYVIPSNGWNDIVWAPELTLFVAVSSNVNGIITSPDAITWTTRSALAQSRVSVTWASTTSSLLAISDLALANLTTVSTDGGITWVTASAPNQFWTSVVYASQLTRYVAVGESSSFVMYANSAPTYSGVMTTANATTWTTRSLSFNQEWRSIVWAPELTLFVAVASSGTGNRVMISANGTAWTTQTSPADNNWQSIVWASSLTLLVAVAASGTGNRVMTSATGTVWVTQSSASDDSWQSVTWSSDLTLFVAVGDSAVMTSGNGIEWSTRVPASTAAWNSVVWSPGTTQFVAVADAGIVMSSSDGITWNLETTPTTNNWKSITWAPDIELFVGVSSTGSGNRVLTRSYRVGLAATLVATFLQTDSITNTPYDATHAIASASYIVDTVDISPPIDTALTVYASLIQLQPTVQYISPLIVYQTLNTAIEILVPLVAPLEAGVQYRIRTNPATASGIPVTGTDTTITLPAATTSSVNDAYKGAFVWVYSTPTSPIPVDFRMFNDYRLIKSYNAATHTVTVTSAFSSDISTAIAAGNTLGWEILRFAEDSYSPLVYVGTQVSTQQMVCYEIQLISLTLPNIILSTGQGNRIAFYPYVYVEFSTTTAPNKHVLYSNNPNAVNALFKVATPNIVDPFRATFVSMSGNGMVQTIKFKPNDNFTFAVYLPNGDLFQTLLQDTTAPFPPLGELQVSATFGLRRLTSS